jgi:transcriptional regulator with XRE-family HTH domain
MEHVSRKIKNIRLKENLSQDAFSKILNYSKGYLADIETGRTKPSRKFLESIQLNFGVSLDWLLSESQILDLIAYNQTSQEPYILFIYAFTQRGLDEAEIMLLDLLQDMQHMMIDASGVTSKYHLLKNILHEEGNTAQLWKRLKNTFMRDNTVMTVKGLSLSKIPRSGRLVQDIFKITDTVNENNWHESETVPGKDIQRPSLIVLDFPSYLEKNLDSFWYYSVPIYATAPKGRRKLS